MLTLCYLVILSGLWCRERERLTHLYPYLLLLLSCYISPSACLFSSILFTRFILTILLSFFTVCLFSNPVSLLTWFSGAMLGTGLGIATVAVIGDSYVHTFAAFSTFTALSLGTLLCLSYPCLAALVCTTLFFTVQDCITQCLSGVRCSVFLAVMRVRESNHLLISFRVFDLNASNLTPTTDTVTVHSVSRIHLHLSEERYTAIAEHRKT
jgi:hypothetical protein